MSSIYIDPQVYTGRPVSPEGALSLLLLFIIA